MTTANLSKLFEFQRFEANTRLQKVIDEVHRRFDEARELTDGELDQIAAAGIKDVQASKKPGDQQI